MGPELTVIQHLTEYAMRAYNSMGLRKLAHLADGYTVVTELKGDDDTVYTFRFQHMQSTGEVRWHCEVIGQFTKP